MRLQEIIQRTSSDSGAWQTAEKVKTVADLKMVPNSDQYGYVIKTLRDSERVNLTGTDLTISFYDTKTPEEIINIGYISFRNVSFPPAKKAVQVTNVLLDNRYRGKGVGIMMYTTILQLGYTIVADETQTPQARKLWVNLNQTPGVEVRGRIEIMRSDIDVENASEWNQEKVKANIKKLKNIGATVYGKLDDYKFNDFVPFDFIVKSGKAGAELSARGIKLYSNKHPEDIEEDYYVNLYARWIG